MFTMAGWTLRCHHQVKEIHKRLKSFLPVVFQGRNLYKIVIREQQRKFTHQSILRFSSNNVKPGVKAQCKQLIVFISPGEIVLNMIWYGAPGSRPVQQSFLGLARLFNFFFLLFNLARRLRFSRMAKRKQPAQLTGVLSNRVTGPSEKGENPACHIACEF